jgi:hypothetical protein
MTRKPSEYDSATYKRNRELILRDDPICHWCRKRKATTADHLRFLGSNTTTPSPSQDFVATSPNQPELASTGHDQPRLQTIIPDHAGSLAGLVGDMAKQVLTD